MRPGTVLCFILVILSARESIGQKRELEYSLYFGESHFIGRGLPLGFLPFRGYNHGYTLAGSAHVSTKPIGQPFRLKIGNQIVFRQLNYMNKERSYCLLDRIPFDVVLSFGKRLSVSAEGGFYAGFLLFMDEPDSSGPRETQKWVYFGTHLKLGIAGEITKMGKLGISLHYYRDLSPFNFYTRYSPGGAKSQIPYYGFDSFLSLDYTIRLN